MHLGDCHHGDDDQIHRGRRDQDPDDHRQPSEELLPLATPHSTPELPGGRAVETSLWCIRADAPKPTVAVARKLLVRLFIMLRDHIDYDEFRRRGRQALTTGSA